MKKVYLVKTDDRCDPSTLAVFSSYEKAKEYIKKEHYNKKYNCIDNFIIVEVIVNSTQQNEIYYSFGKYNINLVSICGRGGKCQKLSAIV